MVAAGSLKIAEWACDIEANEGGCRVTESWTDRRGMLMKKLGGMVSGVDDRTAHNRAGMEQTLACVATAAADESSP